MPDDLDELLLKLRELSRVVASDKVRVDEAFRARTQAEAALLRHVIEIVRPALPAISDSVLDGTERGVELVAGKGGTLLYESGKLDKEPESIVRQSNSKTIIGGLVDRLDRSRRDVTAAKFERQTERVRAILTVLGSGS